MSEKPLEELKLPCPGDWAGSTHWSAVLAAGKPGSPEATAALEELCRTYWYPLYAWVRRRGYGIEEAQDLTQEFFSRMVEKHWLESADPKRGKFRSFLLAAMNHFLANEWRHAHTIRRGSGKALISLDDTAEKRYALEATTELTPEKVYERRWAWSLFERAVSRLREEYTGAGRDRLYEALKSFLADEIDEGDYPRLAAGLGMTHAAVATAVVHGELVNQVPKMGHRCCNGRSEFSGEGRILWFRDIASFGAFLGSSP